MQLNDYQWSRNPRGMHAEGVYRGPNRERVLAWQLGWYKFVAAGEDHLAECQWLLADNITPIMRIYRPRPGAMPVDDYLRTVWASYARAGVKWFEFYNEPNLPIEWPEGVWVHHRNVEGCIRPLCENWLNFAEFIISLGGYPAFPALTEASSEEASTTLWLDAMLGYMRAYQPARFKAVAQNGLWVAAHPVTLNHFYQETPGQPLVPRDPRQQRGTEGGWHFEYPYDPISQAYDPGRTVFGGTPLSPYGDPNGIIAVGVAFMQRLQEWFGLGPVPLVGTEGGVYPTPLEGPQQPDSRYPYYDADSHGEATVAMFNWIVTNAPPWHFGICLWKEDEYLRHGLPALRRMQEVPQLRHPGMSMAAVVPGPGPVHGEPNFHAVVLAPGVEPGWFFETAQAYWNRFRPLVTTTWEFIPLIPSSLSLGVTVIAPPDMADAMREAIQKPYPNVLLDLIIAGGDPVQMAEVFNSRVWSDRRFG